jgi:hypothetical protein
MVLAAKWWVHQLVDATLESEFGSGLMKCGRLGLG